MTDETDPVAKLTSQQGGEKYSYYQQKILYTIEKSMCWKPSRSAKNRQILPDTWSLNIGEQHPDEADLITLDILYLPLTGKTYYFAIIQEVMLYLNMTKISSLRAHLSYCSCLKIKRAEWGRFIRTY